MKKKRSIKEKTHLKKKGLVWVLSGRPGQSGFVGLLYRPVF
jgi:hypothetical protein